PLGLALYTVRDAVAKRPDEVLKLAAAIGFTELEIMRSQIATVCKRSKDLGLRPISVHFETPIITGNWQAWKDAEMPPVDDRLTFDRVLDDANSNGVRNVVFNYLPPKERGDLDYYRGLADKLNAAASKCDAAGMKLWYHNHNFEFAQKAGGRPIDVLLQRLDPRLIPLEVDLFWVSMAGLNPAEFVQQNASRVIAVHLKDRVRGAAVPKFDIASVPTETYKEVGQGDLPFPKILEATARAGVKHHFVEQDHSPDPLASIRSSYDALRKLGY
ncbi:MAG TPA: sugar phosphate isomerase/epimerase, partial [Bryobacteraceae bacterium]|nr:sugar phosphate isomerase/epimerase [Bryobacteraceae bacterium]